MLERFYRPNLVKGAEFEKYYEFPMIEYKVKTIPKYLVPLEFDFWLVSPTYL